jgi:hypothetical protein
MKATTLCALFGLATFAGCGGGANTEGENPGDCSDSIDNDADGQTDCFDAGCALTAECSGSDALAERVTALEAENQSQADKLAELEAALGVESENVDEALTESTNRLDSLENETNTLNSDLTTLADRVAVLESQSSDLITSVYEVDCNYTTLDTVDNLSYCPLVTGVNAANIPMVQFFNNREIEANYLPQWSCWYGGAYCWGGEDTFRFQSPGMGFRYDEDMQTIYAAPHYKANTDPTQTVYTVVVIGDKAYAAP